MSLTERTDPDAGSHPAPGAPVDLPEGHRDAAGGGTAPAGPPVGLGALGWARWGWRQLTSMRTALLLLMLLAVAAVPGSVFPQRRIDPSMVTMYLADHTVVSPWLDRLGLFDVYAAPWFAAVYLLLFISLIGCVLPRTRVHLRSLRQPPPRTPANLTRLPAHRRLEVAGDPDAVLAAARAVLRGRRYRVAEHSGSVAAQRGELRETGNLVFHLALVGVLVSFAVSGLYGYRGQVIVPVGGAFVNASAAYDTFDPGGAFNPDDLPPFRFVLEDLRVRFDGSSAGNQFGAPRDFSATMDVTEEPGRSVQRRTVKVNQPLRVTNASVYLAGNGYAPVVTVRDGTGQVAFSGPVPFLVQDSNYTSRGVVKVTDSLPEQLGLQGAFLPTAAIDPVRGPISTFPDLRKPTLVFTAFAGDLGLDGGRPQNVYTLDRSRMTQLRAADGTPFRASLSPGETVELPGGRGSVTLDAVDRFAGLTIDHDPARAPALIFSLLAIAGLTVSLFVPRRRVWVRAVAVGGRVGTAGGPRTLLEVGALARGEDPGLQQEADAVTRAVQQAVQQADAERADRTSDEPGARPGAGSSA